MDVDAITRYERALRTKLIDAERDLLPEKDRCFKCHDLGNITKEYAECSAEAKK
jgi:hypothetical protein